jgi:uncharacterized protein (DUF486 family)
MRFMRRRSHQRCQQSVRFSQRGKANSIASFSVCDFRFSATAFVEDADLPTLLRMKPIPVVQSAALLVCSNTFMTFAWYAHLRNWADRKWFIVALLSWGIALFEYLFQVPANRIGYSTMSLAQLKVLQEIITLSVFVPFALFYMHQPIKLDYLWAGLCLIGAAYFMFR